MAWHKPVIDKDARSGEGAVDLPLPLASMATPASARPVERIAGVRIIRDAGWCGISLRLADVSDAGQLMHPDLMELSLVTGDGRSVTIATVDGEDAVAVWRSASASTGLAMMVETADGLQAPFPQIGRLALGPIRIRRAHGILNGRRPRFLKRRKTSRLPDRPVMVRGAVLSGL
jgi:hypothetical protein